MAHKEHGAIVGLEQFFQQFQRVDVQVVGGFVEHQHIRRTSEQPRQQQPVALAAREGTYR